METLFMLGDAVMFLFWLPFNIGDLILSFFKWIFGIDGSFMFGFH